MKVESLDDIVERAERAAAWQSEAWGRVLVWLDGVVGDLPVFAGWLEGVMSQASAYDEAVYARMKKQITALYPPSELDKGLGTEPAYNRRRLRRCLERLASGEDV